MIHHPTPHMRLLGQKKLSNKMFWGTWVCAVKCTIDCAPKHNLDPYDIVDYTYIMIVFV